MLRIVAPCAILLASCSPQGSPPDVAVANAWARETVPGQSATAAYLDLSNRGGRSDRLIAVTVPEPATASLHATAHEGGIARMRPVDDGVEVEPGETLQLKPGGAHIMIENLAGPLRKGQRLRLTLRFASSDQRQVDVPVVDAGAAGPAHQDH